MTTTDQIALREPANNVSVNAPKLWRTMALIGSALVWLAAIVAVVVALTVASGAWVWILPIAAIALVLATLPFLTIIPAIRFRVHRWEVTANALYVRSGWLFRTTIIVPISRIQTVDSSQGPLQRMYGLRTVTIMTASSESTVTIADLDEKVAFGVVSDLVAITSADSQDAS